MKKLTLLSGLIMIAFLDVSAQQMPPIPVDKDVKIGKLENGMTYYIRRNTLPEKQANFYIVQKVGSMQEEENQRGLAHFLEHMAFNGTKNFPNDNTGKSLTSYLESIGVKFGQNLNAMTGFDETIYLINNVPATRQTVLDSALMVLHDWSGFLLLRDKDIDKERKVIHEEWRTRQNMNQRMLETLLPTLFKGSKYAERMPIGTMDVIDNFAPEVLRDYYKKWYRPDLQGIIIVGDIDVDKMESNIKTMFADIKTPVNPAERIYEQIPDNDEPLIGIAKDKENPMTNVIVMYKRNGVPADKKTGMDYLIYDFANKMVEKMLTNRLEEILQKENPPFAYTAVSSGAYFGAVHKTDALQLVAISNPGKTDLAIETLMREAKRVKDFGFTAGEYERAKATYMSDLEKLNNERDKQRSDFFVNQYVNHFLKNEPIPAIADKFATMQQMIGYIPLEAINQISQQQFTDKNRVLAILGTENETYSTETELSDLIKKLDAEKLEAYVDNTINEPLIAELPVKGSILNEEKKGDETIWTLSNGALVVVKPTNFKDDEILISGFAQGGTSMISDNHISEIKMMSDEMKMILGETAISVGGLGKFSANDLKKALAGKNISMDFGLKTYSENISGKSNIKDLETALQLLYLNFTSVRNDPQTYASFASRANSVFANLGNNPMVAFSDSIMNAMYMNNPRGRFIKAENIGKADYETMLKLYKERFANAGKFVFTIVGNVNPEEFKPLAEQYIASIPGYAEKSTFNPNAMKARKGKFDNHFTRALETPKASSAIVFSGKMKYNLQNSIQLDALKQVLDIQLMEKIREKLGGTYGVQVMAEQEKEPFEGFTIQMQFDTEPNRRVELVNAINKAVTELQKNGPKAEEVQKIKEFMTKQHADELKKNENTLSSLNKQYRYGADFVSSYQKYVDQLSVKTLKKFANQLFKQGNRVEVSMTSENK